MKYVAPGTTLITHIVGLFDSTGAPLTGKVAATFQVPLLIVRDGSTKGTLTLSDLGAENSAPSSGGLFEHGAGLYRLDFSVSGATGTYTLATSGTLGSLISESVTVNDSTSAMMPSLVVQNNGTSGTITLVGTTTNLTNNTPTAGTITVGPAITAGTITLVNTTTNLTNNTPTAGTITVSPAPTTGTITLVGTTTNLANNTPTAGTITVAPAPTAGTITLVGTTTNLTSLPSIPPNWLTAAGINAAALNGKGDWNTTTPPTAAAIAGQVRTELATELGRLDVAVSSRLAGTSYTAPPTAAQNAAAVWNATRSGFTTTGSFGAVTEWTTNGTASGITKQDVSDAMLKAQSATAGSVDTGSVIDLLLNLTTAGGGVAGSGSDQCTIEVGLSNAEVWISSDAAGSNVIAGTLITNDAGHATFLLDDGVSYYLWVRKPRFNPINGQLFTAVKD